MTTDQYVYSTNDPAAVAAFSAARDAYHAAARRIVEDAEALGKNTGAIQQDLGNLPRLVGLFPDDFRDPPEGWRYVKNRNRLEPAPGKAGVAAREWMEDRQLPPAADVFAALAPFGLQRAAQYWTAEGFSFGRPGLLEHNGTVWALYGAEATGCRWQRRKLSEYYAAVEAAEEAEKAETAGAR